VSNYVVEKAVKQAIKGNGKPLSVVKAGVVILDVQVLSDGDLQESLRSYSLEAATVLTALETAVVTVKQEVEKQKRRIMVPQPNG
jgi:hypothetical protein